jgi:hypothetical protein
LATRLAAIVVQVRAALLDHPSFGSESPPAFALGSEKLHIPREAWDKEQAKRVSTGLMQNG